MAETKHAGEGLRERFENVRARIEAVARLSNRELAEITVVAIGKTHPAAILGRALEIGITDLGENRVQEAESKIAALGRHAARWHLVGHLQTNKARKAVRLFDVIHSLDSVSLALRLDRVCQEEGRTELPVLIQVDLGKEQTKSGIDEEGIGELAKTITESLRLRFVGLMTLPPFLDKPERVRPFFQRLRELRDGLASEGYFLPGRGELSMGMSHDFEVAIEEGATMVRIGTAIFGERTVSERT